MSAPIPPDAHLLLDHLQAWQTGAGPRDTLVRHLVHLNADQGAVLQAFMHSVNGQLAYAPAAHAAHPHDTAHWRETLMACRARVWPAPVPAAVLVGPDVLILTDGQQATILRDQDTRALPGSVAASLLLLAQTIVMAQNAVDAQELQQLQRQRIQANSTSLSEIEPIA